MKPEIMAEEPRYKRRKQANPRRKNVLNYEGAAATASESDDEAAVCSDGEGVDGEKDLGGPAVGVPSLQASPRMGHALLSLKGAEGLRSLHQHWRLGDHIDDTDAHRSSSGEKRDGFGGAGPESVGKASVQTLGMAELDHYFLRRGAEEGEDQPVSIAEYLQRSDTAIIYPEAPEEQRRVGTPELPGQEESEHELQSHTPDDFAQLLTCPYCQRGYKRLSSLKEHIKYRHERSEESLSCPLCSDAFSSRTQLERHMTTHKAGKEQLLSEAGNRKFKCSECGKAFKYKHHLKEHLRIHSGEKPYECSNCKKRFSHSGSYSSHISSKKCISLAALNGRLRSLKPGSSPSSMTSSPESPLPSQLCHKLENGHPLGPVEHQAQLDGKPEALSLGEYCHMMSSHAFGGPDIYLNGHGGSPLGIFSSSPGPQQHLGGFGVDLGQLGYVGHFGNLNEVQKVLEIVDGTVSLQKRDRKPKEVSKLRAHMKELGTQMEEQKPAQPGFHKGLPGDQAWSISDCTLENISEAKGLISESRRAVDIKEKRLPTDLSSEENPTQQLSQFLCFSCQFCKETFSGPIPLHQHERYLCKMNEEIKAVLQPAEDRPSSLVGAAAPDLSIHEGATSTVKSLRDVSVLKTCFDTTAEPTAEDLHKISVAVGLPEDFISDWFSQWKNHQGGRLRTKSDHAAGCWTKNNHRPSTGATAAEQEVQGRSSTPSPLNLSSTPVSNSWSCSYTSEDARGDSPLDLSLPKRDHDGEPPGPSESIGIQKEVLAPEKLLRQPERGASPVFGLQPLAGCHLYAPLPHEAFPAATFMSPGRATMPGFRPYAGLDPLSLLPHVAYSYAAGAPPFPHLQHRRSHQRRAGLQGELLDGKDYLSGLDDLTDSDPLACRKKMKKTESGTYACDLCDKTFQKTSSLLRHKYEHTGRRPHQCQTCQKAFKHKHHLIEHARLHSGEKPYQCDKCGKRFSHSGSYSQHMNHRYSYCKREAEEREEARRGAGGEGGEGPEPRGLLLRRTYLHDLEGLGFSGPGEQQEDGGGDCTILSVSSLERKMDGDRKPDEEVKDRQTRRIGEEEEKQEEDGSGWT